MSSRWKEALANAEPVVTLHAGAEIELVRIAAGEFTMGSPADEHGHAENEAPQRRVRISRLFYLGRFPITRASYRAVMGTPAADSNDNLPMADVRYGEALAFCKRLSSAAGVDVRLPTEAQWEYACRAGTQSRYWSGSAEADLARVGWYRGNSGGHAHPVGEKEPNSWGLYDMHGNVWEYCADFIADYAAMAASDPVGHGSPTHGAMRGGGWMHGSDDCRSARRMVSDEMFGGAGFRIAVAPYAEKAEKAK